MSASAVPMPELPGLWYDASTNRYFKVSADSPQPKPPSPPQRENLTIVPCCGRLLRARELGSVSECSLSASILGRARRRLAPESHFCGANVAVYPGSGCVAMISPPATVLLRHFPSGGCIDSLYVPEGVLAMAWSPQKQLLALAVRGTRGRDCLRLCEFPIHGQRRTVLSTQNLPGEASAMAMAPSDSRFSVTTLQHRIKGGGRVTTSVFELMEMDAVRLRLFSHKDQSQGLATMMPAENSVVTGTRRGNVYKWDLRAQGKPVSILQAPRLSDSVVCLKARKDGKQCFVSSLKNGENNLVCWDWRYTGSGPVLRFSGHQNLCKHLEFDVDEELSGGLLVAGGDDSIVRMWDVNRGGDPLAQLKFDDIALRVALVGWGSKHASQSTDRSRPGAWIITQKMAYALDVGLT